MLPVWTQSESESGSDSGSATDPDPEEASRSVLATRRTESTLKFANPKIPNQLAIAPPVGVGPRSWKSRVRSCLRAIDAALAIEPDKRKLYMDVVLVALKPAVRKQVEEIMIQNYEYQSDYARRYVQQGREEGMAEGVAQGMAEGVLRVLKARGLSVPRTVADRILALRDLKALDAWLTRAVTVGTAEAIFE